MGNKENAMGKENPGRWDGTFSPIHDASEALHLMVRDNA